MRADNPGMNRATRLWCLFLACGLFSCTRKPSIVESTSPPAANAESGEEKSSDGLDLAAPVTAPMHARRQLMDSMRKQGAEAQRRRRALNSVIDQNK